VSFTTPERVRSYGRRSGLPPRQVMMLVARCALVKHLAAEHGDRFVLKGGALLYHVYGTPRVSFVDTDYAEIETRGAPDPIDVERDIVFVDRANGYSLETSPDGRWDEQGYMVRAHNLTYTLDSFQPERDNHARVNISVSFRRSERIDPPPRPLYFDPDGLLSDSTPFPVTGLTLNEAAAEKILAWCLKEDLGKHLADLAILARDHHAEIDRTPRRRARHREVRARAAGSRDPAPVQGLPRAGGPRPSLPRRGEDEAAASRMGRHPRHAGVAAAAGAKPGSANQRRRERRDSGAGVLARSPGVPAGVSQTFAPTLSYAAGGVSCSVKQAV
jgi:hypothetical protein